MYNKEVGRHPIKGNTSMKNYKEALASAVRTAKTMEDAVVVKFWHRTQDFSDCLLTTAVSVGAWDESVIVAAVDHKGKVTEGDWIKEQLASEVAA